MEKLSAILFIITVYLVADHAAIANRRPIRSSIRSVLAPAETITDYETVSPIIIYQSAEATHGNPHDLWIKFDLPTKTFELHLTMNKILLSPKYTESSVENGKTILNKERKNCFYHGTVVGFPEWTVAMSTCVGLRGTFGDHSNVDTLYHIEPLEKTANEIEQTHIVFTSAHLSIKRKNGTCGSNESHIITSHHQNITVPFDRVRRQAATRIVEWFVYNDNRQFIAQQRSLSATALHTIEIANTVDVLYAKIGVRVSLVGVQTWNQQDLITVVSDANGLLDNFHARLRLSTEEFDSAMLITGIDLDGNTIGLAPIGAMCRGRISAGLTQDTGGSVASVASTAAHELGHIFNMRHDDGRSCTCAGTNSRCIMSATLSRPSPVEWSSCSVSDLNAGYAQGLDSCLFNEPTDIFGDPVCGNGIREGEEVCDCGAPDMCDDICCNPNTCQLANGAVCSNREACCSNCQFRTSGTVCRSAKDECDIREVCTGTSGECPDDRSRQDGADCANSQAYCASGVCQNLDTICNATFEANGGTPSAGPQECFNDNTQGDQFGNCGHTSTAYRACATADVRCGQLHCRNAGAIQLSFSTSINIFTTRVFVNRQLVTCRSYSTLPGDDTMPGLVPEGAKCGTNRLCRNRRCVTRQLTACPTANAQECSGNGVCNDLNQCSCNPGYTGANCNSLVNGGGVNGGWTQWSSWSSCTVTCGAGSRTRTRSCTNPAPQGDGADCVGSTRSTESCNIVPCPVDGGWGSWSSWSACSATCGGGQRTRQRSCNNPAPSGGGNDCTGSNSQQQTCNTANCPVDGGWGSWSSWSSCSATCGGGRRTRQRSCINPPPSGGGNDCTGSNSQQQTCNTADCPVNGGWGSWTTWSSCSVTCGSGQRTRERFCNNPMPSGGGSGCPGISNDQQTCTLADCPIDGQWGPFGSWSTCSQTCGGGRRTRQRSCNNPPPSNGGADCPGRASRRNDCNTFACPVDGGWGDWSNYSSCSATCGEGQQTRRRVCDSPPASDGGTDCDGAATNQRTCNIIACPTNPSSTTPTSLTTTTSCSGATCSTSAPITVTENPTATSGPNDSTNVTRNSGGRSGGGGGSGAAIGGAVAAIVIILVIIVIIVLVIVVYRRRRATKFLPVATSSRNEPDFAYREPQSSYGFDNTRGSVYPTRSAVPPRLTNPPSRPTNPPSVSGYNPPPVVDQPSQPQRRGAPPPPTKTQLYPKVSSPTQAPLRPQVRPKPQAPLMPQAPSKPQAPPKPPAPTAPPKPQVSSKPEVAPRPKPREWPPQSDNADGRGGPPVAPKKPLRPPPRNH